MNDSEGQSPITADLDVMPGLVPRPTDGYGNRCRDFDKDCWGIADKFGCWKYDPEQGVCPFLTGEESDNG